MKQFDTMLKSNDRSVEVELKDQIADTFFELLKYILIKFKVPYKQQNMTALVNPYDHILYDFFREKNGKLEINRLTYYDNELQTLQKQMDQVCGFIKRAKSMNIYVGDL